MPTTLDHPSIPHCWGPRRRSTPDPSTASPAPTTPRITCSSRTRCCPRRRGGRRPRVLGGPGGRTHAHVPLRRHQPLRTGRQRRYPRRHAQPLPRHPHRRRRRRGQGRPRGHRPTGEHAAGPVPPQARAGSGQRDRLHDRRRRREQLQRHGLRHHRELVPDDHVDGRRAAQRHRPGHRTRGRRGRAPRRGTRPVRRAVVAPGASARLARERRVPAAAVLDEEHDGLRPERPARLRRPGADPEHLLIGSEGTLGFVAEARFRTIEVRPRSPPVCSSSRRCRRR